MLKNLGFEFSRDVHKDISKRILLPAKWILQGILAWPDSNRPYATIFNWFSFLNFVVLTIFQINYLVVNFGDVEKMANTCTVFLPSLQAMAKTFVLISKKKELNMVLHTIWRDFWPTSVVTKPRKYREIKTLSYFSLALTTFFLTMGCLASTQFLTRPFLEHELILKTAFPFAWNATWVFENIYVWQYFTNWYVIFVISGFDYLLISVVTICTVQYMIVQDVLEHMLDDGFKRHKRTLFGSRGEAITRTQVLIGCLEQHKMLNRLCELLEESFAIVILIQFSNSTLAMCMSALVMKIDPQVLKLSSYFAGHLFQLFYYCYAGNELEYQSTHLADAVYESNWHLHYEKDFNRILIMIIQRAQRKQCLTAAGITQMNFASFLKVLRISFSTYTLMDTLLKK